LFRRWCTLCVRLSFFTFLLLFFAAWLSLLQQQQQQTAGCVWLRGRSFLARRVRRARLCLRRVRSVWFVACSLPPDAARLAARQSQSLAAATRQTRSRWMRVTDARRSVQCVFRHSKGSPTAVSGTVRWLRNAALNDSERRTDSAVCSTVCGSSTRPGRRVSRYCAVVATVALKGAAGLSVVGSHAAEFSQFLLFAHVEARSTGFAGSQRRAATGSPYCTVASCSTLNGFSRSLPGGKNHSASVVPCQCPQISHSPHLLSAAVAT